MIMLFRNNESPMMIGNWVIRCLFFVLTVTGLSESQTSTFISLEPSDPTIEKLQGTAMVVTCYSDRGQHTTWLNTKAKQVVFMKGRIHVELTRQTGLSLVIEDIKGDDRGNYTCKTVVDGKEQRKSFELTVVVPTTFNKTPEVQEAELGHNLMIRCHARGEPKPSIMWRFNERPVEGGERYRFLDQGLLIYNVSLNDSGVYVCRALQLASFVSTLHEFHITALVLHKPMFEKQNDTVHGYLSGAVNLTCHAKAEPKPMYEWTKDKQVIAENVYVSLHEDNNSSTLELTLNEKSVYGNYTCKASNKFGSSEKLLILKEGDRPQPPEELKGFHVTWDSIKMKIVPPNNGELPVTGYRVQYVPKHGNEIRWDDGKFMDFGIDDGDTYTLQGLSQDTEYAFRVQSRNAAGFSSHSEEEILRTEHIQADSITESSAVRATLSALYIISVQYLLRSKYLSILIP